MRFQAGQKRNGLAAANFFLVLSAITVGLIVVTAALISQGTSSLPTNPNDYSSSSSLGSSSSVFSSSSSFIQSTVQSSSVSSNSSLSQSAAQYPLVWGPNPVTACSGIAFCVYATLGFSGQTATNDTSSATTIIQGNATTIIISSTTTIMSGVSTGVYFPSPNASYPVTVTAFVQDALTGQNATTPNGVPFVASTCYIQPTGFTKCIVGAPYMPVVPPGHLYKVTVFVTTGDGKTMLAPPSPTVTGAFDG
jgi:hypothetical protein